MPHDDGTGVYDLVEVSRVTARIRVRPLRSLAVCSVNLRLSKRL
jgi:hypothetical protein